MTTRQELRDQLRGYGKRSTLTDAELDGFIDNALADLETLRSAEQEQPRQELVLAGGEGQLPADFLFMREVRSVVGRQVTYLRRVGRRALTEEQNAATRSGRVAGDAARVYGISGRTIEVAGGGDSTIEIIYWDRVLLPNDDSSHPATVRYPGVFIQAGLVWLYEYLGDYEAQAGAITKRDAMVTDINVAGAGQGTAGGVQ